MMSCMSYLRNVHRQVKRLQLNPVSYFDDIRKIVVPYIGLYGRFYIIADGFDEIPLRDQVAPLAGTSQAPARKMVV